MLATRNLRLNEPNKKLSHKFVGPFKVLAAIGSQAYRLALPSAYRIHNVFHVSLLEAHHRRDDGEPVEELPLPDLAEGEQEYEVELVLDRKTRKGIKFFLVKWKGWPEEYNEWVLEDSMENLQDRIAAYEA